MAGEIYFEDNTLKVIDAVEDTIEAALLECSAEVVSATARNTRVDDGQLKNSWRGETKRTSGGYEAVMGSPLENALWEEFGTGEHALEGNGRKGAWYVPAEGYSGKKKPSYQGKVVVVYGKGGKKYYKTDGKKPSRAFKKAIDKQKPKIAKHFRNKFGIVFK